MTMKQENPRIERITAFSLLILAIVYTADSLTLKIGRFTSPGPGLIPLIVGILFTFSTGLWLIQTFIRSSEISRAESKRKFEMKDYAGVIVMAVCVVSYPLILWFLNFIIATFLLTLPMLTIGRPGKIFSGVIIATTISFAAFFIFSVLLGVNLPMGPIEIFIFSHVGGVR